MNQISTLIGELANSGAKNNKPITTKEICDTLLSTGDETSTGETISRPTEHIKQAFIDHTLKNQKNTADNIKDFIVNMKGDPIIQESQ